MALVAARCTQCGANIEVDDTKEAGICKYCGTAFITEKAINNLNITNSFSNCTVNIYTDSNETIFEIDGRKFVPYNGQTDVKKPIFEIDDDKLVSYNGESEIVEVPNHVTVIGESAFSENHKVEKIILPDSVMIIGGWAFYDCINLKEIVIPDSVTTIGILAFRACKSLKEIVIPDSVTTIEIRAFSGCENLKRVVLPSNLQILAKWLFEDCTSLEEVVLPNNLETIGDECFAHCTLKEIVIPKSVKRIKGSPFSYCNLDKIIFENSDNIVYITENLFCGSNKIPEIIASNKFKMKFGKYLTNVKKETGSCYIATCVYGSYDCPQVWTLRRFRDDTLDTTWYGRVFIKCYYAISPMLVKCFGETKLFRRFWKTMLDRMVSDLNNKGVDDSYYIDKN